MKVLKYVAFGAFVLLAACTFAMYLAWSDAVGVEGVLATVRSVTSTFAGILATGGVILVGDASFLRQRIWVWVHSRLQNWLALVLAPLICLIAVALMGIAWASHGIVVFSANQTLTLVNAEKIGTTRDIATIEAGSEHIVILRTGTRLLGYRLIGTECAGGLAPIHVAFSLRNSPAHRVHINSDGLECDREVLYSVSSNDSPILDVSRVESEPMTVQWGLEEQYGYYKEIEASEDQNAGNWPRAADGAATMRHFTIVEPRYTNAVMPLFERAGQLYSQYRNGNGAASRREFQEFVRQNDWYLIDRFRQLAPRLYFDFMGDAQREYILLGVSVRVHKFDEYMGGGFVDDSHSYDIVLVPRLGEYEYVVDRRLRFRGSGRAELTFFSDNFYEGMGLSPMGAYTISLSFEFLVNGNNRVSVSTETFKIDV